MISPETVARLKSLLAQASKPPMVVSPLGFNRNQVMLSTLQPGAVVVGTFVDDPNVPQHVATFRAMVNAELVKLLWENAADLLDTYERCRTPIGEPIMSEREPSDSERPVHRRSSAR